MVLDGRNAPTQVIGVVNFPNSVNPKLFKHGNTEPSVKACVETGRETSDRDEGTVRTARKLVEPYRNATASQQCEVTFLIISTIVGGCAPTQVIGVVQEVNSVNPKPFRHGNTEPNSEKSDKCVETKCFLSLMDKDIVRAYGKPYEAFRNETLALNKCSNKTDHRLRPHGNSSLPSVSVMRLLNCPNSVNPKSYRYGNTEPSMNLRFKACVENIQAASIWKKICSEPQGNLWNQPEMS
jgi:hypothetical protein